MIINKIISKQKTFLIKPITLRIIKRTMILSRCTYAARAAYHIVTTISNYQINDNNELFISKVVNNALDYNQGIPQHKATLWKHFSNKRLPGEYYYESFKDQVSNAAQIVKYEPNVEVDFRTTKELSILKPYIENFCSDVAWIYATLDSRPATFFKASQTNPDFWVFIDKPTVLKSTYQDEKSGMDMMRHSTRGSIGMLCYNEKGENIQITRKPFTLQSIIDANYDRLADIENALKHDNIITDSTKAVLYKAKKIVNNMENKSFHEIQDLHNDLQQHLWKELQCNPNYNRSISFIFLKQIINSPMTEKEAIFSQAFHSKLKDNYLYDLDKKGDVKEMYNAIIYAGKKVDPYFVDKLHFLHKSGITLTNDILTIMKEITKNGVH